MQKCRRILLFASVVLVSVLFFSGCLSASKPYPMVNDEATKKKVFESPETHTLIYGFIAREKGLFDITEPNIPILDFAQINPERKQMLVNPGIKGTFFYFQPVEPGVHLHLIYYAYYKGRDKYYAHPSLQKGYNLSLISNEPGLQYAGHYILTSVTKENQTFFRRGDDYGFHDIGEKTELDALNQLLKQVKKTEWEPLVLDRIKELENE